MTRVGFQTEAELAAVVRGWLLSEAWDVYQEVGLPGGAVADLVARRGPVLWVVECKLTFSLAVIEQAHGWVGRANCVSVAVPPTRRGGFAQSVCGRLGVGVLVVLAGDDYSPPSVRSRLAPELRRRRSERLVEAIRPEHRTYCQAGSQSGARFTPFRATCEALIRHVASEPGCTLKAAVDGVKHHYCNNSSARSNLRKLLEDGIVPELRLERTGKVLTLWPTEVRS